MDALEQVCKLLAEAIKGWGPTLRLAVLLVLCAVLARIVLTVVG